MNSVHQTTDYVAEWQAISIISHLNDAAGKGRFPYAHVLTYYDE